VPKLSEYVKVAEAADILGVSPGTLRNWAEAGKISMTLRQTRLTLKQILFTCEIAKTNSIFYAQC
jgi:predicted site-specific integrase-resolvase